MRHSYVGFLPLITVIIIITRPDTLAKMAKAIIAESLIINITGISRPCSFRSSMHGIMYASSEQPTAPETALNSRLIRVISSSSLTDSRCLVLPVNNISRQSKVDTTSHTTTLLHLVCHQHPPDCLHRLWTVTRISYDHRFSNLFLVF